MCECKKMKMRMKKGKSLLVILHHGKVFDANITSWKKLFDECRKDRENKEREKVNE